MKIIIIIVSFIFISCNKENSDRIVLTSGLSMNPDEPRFGIEIKKDTLYYCEETAGSSTKYNYYKSKIDPIVFLNLRKEIKNEFKVILVNKSIVDATQFQLYTSFDEKIEQENFYFTFLNEKQKKLINGILKLKDNKLEKIKYHNFPSELLTEKLPQPPNPKNE